MDRASQAVELETRLDALRGSGWSLSERRVYTLRRLDRDGSERSFHGEELAELVRRVEAASAVKPEAEAAEQKAAALTPGWVKLEPEDPRPDESVYSAGTRT